MMKGDLLIEFLKQRVSLCKHFSDDHLKRLVQDSCIVSYEANETVVSVGQDASFLGVLLEGDLAVSIHDSSGQRQVLAHLKPGDTFGEMALMSGDKTLADFIAETRCEVLRIPVSVFQAQVISQPGAVQHISRTIADRIKLLLVNPAQVAAAFRQSEDP